MSSIIFIVLLMKFANASEFCDLVLDRRNYDGTATWSRLKRCTLHEYKQADFVECLNVLNQRPLNEVARLKPYRHFHFIGDSRIRQQFMSFLKMFPDYDLVYDGKFNADMRTQKIQFDMTALSEILSVRISSYFGRTIREETVEQFRRFLTPPYSSTPTLLVIGICVHHMQVLDGELKEFYERKLVVLEKYIRKLTKLVDVIWYVQPPMIETWVAAYYYGGSSTHVYSEKINTWNQVSKKILQNSGVRFWDSTSPLIEEYIRGCQQHYRKDKRNYYACHDGLHAGYIVVGQSTQILLNFMCNKVLADDANHSVAFGNGTCCYS